MEKKLAYWLENEYEMKGPKVVRKGELSATIYPGDKKRETRHIFPDDSYWVLANTKKGDPNLIVSCSTVLNHSYCLHLQKLYDVKIPKQNRYVQEMARPDNDWHGLVWVFTEKGTFGDGECMSGEFSNIQPSMKSYPMIMAMKRAEDRAIIRELGLYHQGFMSDVENPEDTFDEKEIDKIRQRNEDNNRENLMTPEEIKSAYIKALKLFMEEHKEEWDKDADKANSMLQSLVATFLNKPKEQCETKLLTIEELRTATVMLNKHRHEQKEFKNGD